MSSTNRLLVRILLIGLPLLVVGGCVVAALVPDSAEVSVEGGVPVPVSDYEFSDRFCFSVEELGGGGIITNTGERGRRYRIVVRGEDPSDQTRDSQVEVVTRWVRPGDAELVLLPPWAWAEDSVEDVLDVGQFDCSWAVLEP